MVTFPAAKNHCHWLVPIILLSDVRMVIALDSGMARILSLISAVSIRDLHQTKVSDRDQNVNKVRISVVF